MTSPAKKISIVTPVYNEEDNVAVCHETIRNLFADKLPGYDYEHIFCDNDSKDRTVEILRCIALSDARVKIIVNARNFGPLPNAFNGLLASSGDACIPLLAVDLQDPPELIPRFVEKWLSGYEVVYGIREKREESWMMRNTRRVFYRTVSRFSDFYIPPDAGEFQLIDQRVVKALRQFEDVNPYTRGMIASCGFRSTGIPYTWKRRSRGFSKNSLYNLIDQGLNGLISFSRVPLRFAMLSGFVLAALSLAYAFLSLVINLVFYRQLAASGVATLIVALFFFSGVQLCLIGLLGEYIGAIHFQVRKRPMVIERARFNF